jgi:hypothetical protein
MFILQHINSLRGVIPTHEYKQFLKSSELILECLNNNLLREDWEYYDVMLDGVDEKDIKDIKASIAMATTKLINCAHIHKEIRCKINLAKCEIKMLSGVKEEITKLRQSNVKCKKVLIRKLKFETETNKAVIMYQYNTVLKLIDLFRNLIVTEV